METKESLQRELLEGSDLERVLRRAVGEELSGVGPAAPQLLMEKLEASMPWLKAYLALATELVQYEEALDLIGDVSVNDVREELGKLRHDVYDRLAALGEERNEVRALWPLRPRQSISMGAERIVRAVKLYLIAQLARTEMLRALLNGNAPTEKRENKTAGW